MQIDPQILSSPYYVRLSQRAFSFLEQYGYPPFKVEFDHLGTVISLVSEHPTSGRIVEIDYEFYGARVLVLLRPADQPQDRYHLCTLLSAQKVAATWWKEELKGSKWT